MGIRFLIFILLTCTACQTQAPYAARLGTTDYYHPVRAKIEHRGKLMTCSGFVGRNEEGDIVVSLKPVDYFYAGTLGSDDMYIDWFQWQANAEHRISMHASWVDEKRDFLLSSMLIVDLDQIEVVDQHLPWTLMLDEFSDQLEAEPNGTEWRVTRNRAGFEEVLIFGRGGPWQERPEGSFRILEEQDSGNFTLDGVILMQPYWRVFDERGKQPLDPEIVLPRTPH